MTTGGFAGFQTQLSTTANKRRDEEAPLLEAFLDANGRLAYRFVDKDGNVVAQPKVTTPGFVHPVTGGITPPIGGPGGTTPSITPQASGVLTGGVGATGDRGQAGELRGDIGMGAPRIQTAPMTRTQRGLASMLAGPFGVPISLGLQGLQSLGAGVVGGGSPTPQTAEFQTLTDATRSAELGFASPDEFSEPDPTFDFTLGDRTGDTGGAGETVSDPTGSISEGLNDDMEDDFGSFDGGGFGGGDGGDSGGGGGTGGGGDTGAEAGGGPPGDR